jgi:hypothetical protein
MLSQLLTFSYDSLFLKESKALLLDLLTSSNYAAVVTQEHLADVTFLLSKHTHHLYQEFSIERSNYSNVAKKLDEINTLSETVFCTLLVTGTLSALDLARLLDRLVGGSIKLLIVYYAQLMYSLHLTGKGNSVLLPNSLVRFNLTKVTPYIEQSQIFKVMETSFQIFSANPSTLGQKSELDHQVLIEQERAVWYEEEEKWRATSIPFNQRFSGTITSH